jgi:hypothetical protein
LGTAATAASGDFATAAQGVTNGNSHDHNGGDGAQIAYGSLSGLPTLGSLAALSALGSITSVGAIGSTANLPIITTTDGALSVGAFGTGANQFCQGNDARLSDPRTPTAHNQAWSTITSTPTTLSGYGVTMATARILGRSAAGTGAPEEFGLLGLAFNGTNLATLADLVIPLSDETTALTASSTVAKVTISYWPRATVLTDLPIWAVATAPTGAALQFDIQVGGSSIYLPASGGTYPTIAISATNSTASAGAFTTAFAAAPTIAVGSVVTFFVRQIGSTVAGAGLKVALLTRRAG